MKEVEVNIDELNKELDALLYASGIPIRITNVDNERALVDLSGQEEDSSVQEDKSSINSELIGTWYLVRSDGGALFVSKDAPGSKKEHYRLNPSKSGYMQIFTPDDEIADDTFTEGDWSLRPEDFTKLDLPEVTEDNSPLEIEIVKSGNVYFYES